MAFLQKFWRDTVRSFLERLRRKSGQGTKLSLAKLVASAVSMVGLVFIARFTAIDDFSRFTVVLGLGMATNLLHDGGRVLDLTRSVGIQPHFVKVFTLRALRARLLLAVISIGFVSMLVMVAYRDATLLVIPMALSALSTIVYSTIFGALRGLGKIRVEGFNELVSRSVVLICIVIIGSRVGLSDSRAMWLYAIVDTCSALCVVLVTRREFGDTHETMGIPETSRKSRTLAVFVASLAGGLIFRLVPLLLATSVSDEEVAVFVIASKLIEVAILPIGISVGISVGEFAGRAQAEVLREQLRRWIPYTMVVTTLLVFTGGIFIPIVFGANFDEFGSDFRWLLTAVFPHCIVVVILGVSFSHDSRSFLIQTLSFAIPIYFFMSPLAPIVGTQAFVVGSWVGFGLIACQVAGQVRSWRGGFSHAR